MRAWAPLLKVNKIIGLNTLTVNGKGVQIIDMKASMRVIINVKVIN